MNDSGIEPGLATYKASALLAEFFLSQNESVLNGAVMYQQHICMASGYCYYPRKNLPMPIN